MMPVKPIGYSLASRVGTVRYSLEFCPGAGHLTAER